MTRGSQSSCDTRDGESLTRQHREARAYGWNASLPMCALLDNIKFLLPVCGVVGMCNGRGAAVESAKYAIEPREGGESDADGSTVTPSCERW